jgi:uncharacterized protein GlcG (DUF336 family)
VLRSAAGCESELRDARCGVLLQAGSDFIGAIGVVVARGSENDEVCAVAAIDKIRNRLRSVV